MGANISCIDRGARRAGSCSGSARLTGPHLLVFGGHDRHRDDLGGLVAHLVGLEPGPGRRHEGRLDLREGQVERVDVLAERGLQQRPRVAGDDLVHEAVVVQHGQPQRHVQPRSVARAELAVEEQGAARRAVGLGARVVGRAGAGPTRAAAGRLEVDVADPGLLDHLAVADVPGVRVEDQPGEAVEGRLQPEDHVVLALHRPAAVLGADDRGRPELREQCVEVPAAQGVEQPGGRGRPTTVFHVVLCHARPLRRTLSGEGARQKCASPDAGGRGRPPMWDDWSRPPALGCGTRLAAWLGLTPRAPMASYDGARSVAEGFL